MERAAASPVPTASSAVRPVTDSDPAARPSGAMACGLALAVLVSACGSGSTDASHEGGEAPRGADGATAQQATDRVPGHLLGTYDSDEAACAQGMTVARLTVAPDTLRFYYGYATVDAVAEVGGGVRVDATLYQQEGAVEVVPEEATYRLTPTDGGLRLESDYGGTSRLVRCGARTAGPAPSISPTHVAPPGLRALPHPPRRLRAEAR